MLQIDSIKYDSEHEKISNISSITKNKMEQMYQNYVNLLGIGEKLGITINSESIDSIYTFNPNNLLLSNVCMCENC